jgi:hypothetical protein
VRGQSNISGRLQRRRDLLADGDRVGVTNHTILLAPDKLFAGLRVYNIPVDFDRFLPEQRQLQIEVKNIGTSWSLSPIQLQQAVEGGRLLLRQLPCFQRLLLGLKVRPARAEPDIVRNSCPFEDDKTS